MSFILDPIPPSTSVIDITRASSVKVFLEIASADTQYDAWITQAIKSVSKRFEAYLGRGISRISRTEYMDVAPGQMAFKFSSWPVTVVDSVRNDSLSDFGSGTEIDVNLRTIFGGEGFMFMKNIVPQSGPVAMRVTYTGGMAADTTSFMAAYPDISEAADMQVGFLDKRRRSIETSSASSGGATVDFTDVELLPEVKDRLDRYRRVSVGE